MPSRWFDPEPERYPPPTTTVPAGQVAVALNAREPGRGKVRDALVETGPRPQ